MRFIALATDYDGTIAAGGLVPESTFAAFERMQRTGRKVLLVTGRELPDLMRVCPRLDAFDRIVAENGALLYNPATHEEIPLALPPPRRFVESLKARGVSPMSVGRVIVATWQPHENVVLETIRDLGLELQVIFNKGAVMILPSGVNKATGLASALDELCLSPHNLVAVGDAENDHALCQACEASAAVANALPTLKEAVDIALVNHHGAGVEELIAAVLQDDLLSIEPRLARHHLLLGHTADGAEIRLPPHGSNLLITGPRGGGKSSLAAALLERLTKRSYQFCVVDPDGSYGELDHATAIGQGQRSLDLEAVVQLLERPNQNALVHLLNIVVHERPQVFAALTAALDRLRTKSGRPHWLVVDDAEHLLPFGAPAETLALPTEIGACALITEKPAELAPSALARINTLAVVGQEPERFIAEFCQAAGRTPPMIDSAPLAPGEMIYWRLDSGTGPIRVRIKQADNRPTAADRRVVSGDLGRARSFFFRGPQGKLNLRASNLDMFVQLAEGLDDDTWLYHLRRHDFSHWLREGVRHPELAESIERVEREKISAIDSRAAIRKLVEEHFRLPLAPSTNNGAPADATPTGGLPRSHRAAE